MVKFNGCSGLGVPFPPYQFFDFLVDVVQEGVVASTNQLVPSALVTGKRSIFGKVVMQKAMQAKTIVKAFPSEVFKVEVRVNIDQVEATQAENREISSKAVTVKMKPGKIIARASLAKFVNDEF